jgi:hypothetical protein
MNNIRLGGTRTIQFSAFELYLLNNVKRKCSQKVLKNSGPKSPLRIPVSFFQQKKVCVERSTGTTVSSLESRGLVRQLYS